MYHEIRLIRLLKREGWKYRVKWMSKCLGHCSFNRRRITFDLMTVVAGIIVHENLHAEDRYKSWKHSKSEKQVRKQEEKRTLKMSRSEAEAIVREVFPELYRLILKLEGL